MRRWKKMNVRSVWWPETSLQGLEHLPRIMGRLLILKVVSVTAPLCSWMHRARQSGQYLKCVTGVKKFSKEELTTALLVLGLPYFSLGYISLSGCESQSFFRNQNNNCRIDTMYWIKCSFVFCEISLDAFFSVFKNQCDIPNNFLRIILKKYKW